MSPSCFPQDVKFSFQIDDTPLGPWGEKTQPQQKNKQNFNAESNYEQTNAAVTRLTSTESGHQPHNGTDMGPGRAAAHRPCWDLWLQRTEGWGWNSVAYGEQKALFKQLLPCNHTWYRQLPPRWSQVQPLFQLLLKCCSGPWDMEERGQGSVTIVCDVGVCRQLVCSKGEKAQEPFVPCPPVNLQTRWKKWNSLRFGSSYKCFAKQIAEILLLSLQWTARPLQICWGFFHHSFLQSYLHTNTFTETTLVWQQQSCCFSCARPVSIQGGMLKTDNWAACLLASPSYSTMETRCMEVTEQ